MLRSFGAGLLLTFLTASFGFAENPSTDFRCFIISGMQGDSKKVFGDYREIQLRKMNPNLDRYYFNQFECERVVSWTQLEMRVSELDASTRLLVVQSSHGGEGGTCSSCEGGKERGFDTLLSMNRLAQTHPTLVLLDSCYSGDVLALKLLHDEEHVDNPAIDRLCLQTGSNFGDLDKGSVAGDLDQFSPMEESGEDFFYKSFSSLLSSSLPWSESGIVSDFVPASGKNSAQELFKASEWSFDRKEEMSIACNELAVNLVDLVIESIRNTHIDPAGEVYCRWKAALESSDCAVKNAKPLEALAESMTEGGMNRPEWIRRILETLLSGEYAFAEYNPFDILVRNWSLDMREYESSRDLDKRRKKACTQF